MLTTAFLGALAISGVTSSPTRNSMSKRDYGSNLEVKISIAPDFLAAPTDGRVVLMFAPNGTDPLDDTDVTSSPNKIFGKNVYNLSQTDIVTLSGGSNYSTTTGVYGWPNISLNEIPAGTYSVQAFLTKYETVTRSDGSTISVHFPCGDGAPNVNTFGSLTTTATDVEISGSTQTLELTFNNITAIPTLAGKEIGSCNQGNYADTKNLKYLKIRSPALSAFWKRDMYVGANILLPASYNASDPSTRYPVIYSQGHWPGGQGAFGYADPSDTSFTDAWDNGIIPNTSTPIPNLILVTFRHEAPFYDDSYAVNTANLGPYGAAINDELIPAIDSAFNTIASPYARIQEGGSTGGWESAASLIYRPDLFGACFSSYPDSLSFYRHQDIELYTAANAYQRANGSYVPSIRTHKNGTEILLASVAQENHWELTFGTNSRSANQWDIWNAVFGVQGYNNYPLEPWDKITGEIFHGAVDLWRDFDLTEYIITHFNASTKNLGEVLKGRIYVYVGTWDNYYLNEGVAQFQQRTDAVGGKGWANVTILPDKPHGGNYQDREIWDYLQLLESWITDHAPGGKMPLTAEQTSAQTRGNIWEDVIEKGGRSAAIKRQANPEVKIEGGMVKGSVGRWDPGVVLTARWIVNGEAVCQEFEVKQSETVDYTAGKKGDVQLLVTGEKRGYKTETRGSSCVQLR